MTWPFLRDHVLGNATAELPLPEVCGALRAQGRLLVEVHANAVRAPSAHKRTTS